MEFLLDDEFFFELFSHGLGSKEDSVVAAADVALSLVKEISSVCVIRGIRSADLLKHEITQGESSPDDFLYEIAIPSEAVVPSADEVVRMTAREKVLGEHLDFPHPAECENGFKQLTRVSGGDLWPNLAKALPTPEGHEIARKHAAKQFETYANAAGWVVSPKFNPAPGWFSFSIALADGAYILWKYSRYGDSIPEPRKPANPVFDMIHLAFVGIADGLLSCDQTLLNMAWACWPSKRNSIYTYDRTHRAIVPFTADWKMLEEHEC